MKPETTTEIMTRFQITNSRADYLAHIGVLNVFQPAKRRGMSRGFTYRNPAEVLLVNALLDNRMLNRVSGVQLESMTRDLPGAVEDGRTTLLLWCDLIQTDSGLKWQQTGEFVRPEEVMAKFTGSGRIGFLCIQFEQRVKALAATGVRFE